MKRTGRTKSLWMLSIIFIWMGFAPNATNAVDNNPDKKNNTAAINSDDKRDSGMADDQMGRTVDVKVNISIETSLNEKQDANVALEITLDSVSVGNNTAVDGDIAESNEDVDAKGTEAEDEEKEDNKMDIIEHPTNVPTTNATIATSNDNADADTADKGVQSSPPEKKTAQKYFVVHDDKTNTSLPLVDSLRNLYKSDVETNPNILTALNAQRTSILKVISNLSVSISGAIWDLQDNPTLIALLKLIDNPQDSFKHAVNLQLQKLLQEIEELSDNVTSVITQTGYKDITAIQTHVTNLEDELNRNLPSSHSDDEPLCKKAKQPQIETMATVYVNAYRDVCINAFQNYTAKSLDDATTAFTGVFSTVEMLVGTLFSRELPAPEVVKQQDLKQFVDIFEDKMTETLERISSISGDILKSFAVAGETFEKCHGDALQKGNQTLDDASHIILACGNTVQ